MDDPGAGVMNNGRGLCTMTENDFANIYCDESCHLMSDAGPMALGALCVPAASVYRHCLKIRELKRASGISPRCELKWSGASPAKLELYEAVVRYFFSQPDLRFRAVVIPSKGELDHVQFAQTHDDWYYKMFFVLLEHLIDTTRPNQIYLDIKDTHGKRKAKKLHDVLCNNEYDFKRERISRVQVIRSHEVELMSIVDIFIGALTYQFRKLSTSAAKLKLIELVRQESGLQLLRSSLVSEQKFNLLVWQPRKGGGVLK